MESSCDQSGLTLFIIGKPIQLYYPNHVGMGFWKTWFSTPEAVATSKTTPFEEHTAEAASNSSPNGVSETSLKETRIVFSTERDIDLYELEELCDAVGWSRRPLRKVKKAIEHSFSGCLTMWEVRGNSSSAHGGVALAPPLTTPSTPPFGMWLIHPRLSRVEGLGKALMQVHCARNYAAKTLAISRFLPTLRW